MVSGNARTMPVKLATDDADLRCQLVKLQRLCPNGRPDNAQCPRDRTLYEHSTAGQVSSERSTPAGKLCGLAMPHVQRLAKTSCGDGTRW